MAEQEENVQANEESQEKSSYETLEGYESGQYESKKIKYDSEEANKEAQDYIEEIGKAARARGNTNK